MRAALELWLPIPGTDGAYEISSLGRVRRMKPDPRTRIGRIMALSSAHGWPIAKLSLGSRYRTIMVHRMVAEVFLGPAHGKVVRFRDDKRSNCGVTNLYYGDRRRNGARGERNGRSKLTDYSVRHIRAMLADRYTVSATARRAKVSRRAVQYVRDGVRWSHVK